MPSRPYAQYTRPEQSNPLAGEMPPQLYGTPTALSAIFAARSPRVGLGFGMRVGACSLGNVGTCRLTLGGSSLFAPAVAQAKTIAARANASRALRRRFGIVERGTTGR